MRKTLPILVLSALVLAGCGKNQWRETKRTGVFEDYRVEVREFTTDNKYEKVISLINERGTGHYASISGKYLSQTGGVHSISSTGKIPTSYQYFETEVDYSRRSEVGEEMEAEKQRLIKLLEKADTEVSE